MSVLTIGLDHRSAPLDLRGRFAFDATALPVALRSLRERLDPAHEVAIVSTCNRTELYIGAPQADPGALAAHGLGWLAEAGDLPARSLEPHTYTLADASAARHAFRLASGLGSMVVGETQILGQMKQAVREADTAGTLGTTLHQLFQRSFSVAKEVRASTAIGMHTVSLAAAVVRLARQLFGEMTDLRVLLVGAGDMAAPVLAHVAAHKPKHLTLANRSRQRGEALAAPFNAEAIGLAEAVDRLDEFDLVVSCTASSVPVIGLGAVTRALKARRQRPMLMVDLAVPRDIEAEVGRLDNVYLYTIDDLSEIVQAGSDKRQAAVGQAETIIDASVQDYMRWLGLRETVPMIRALQQQADLWRAAELQRARKSIAKGDDIDAVLEGLARGLAQKMLHGSLAGLQAAEGDERIALSATLSRMFLQCPMRSTR